MINRRGLVAGLCLLLVPAMASQAKEGAPPSALETTEYIDPGYLWVKDLLSENRKSRRAAAEQIVASGDRGLAFGIVDSLFFIPAPLRKEAFSALRQLTGADPGDSYWNWVEWAGEAGETVRPTAGYARWKVILLSKIDPGYGEIMYPGAPERIRLEEVVPGGVRIDGIPSLDDPPMVPSGDAGYLKDDEEVFGVLLDGETRAYPLRFLDWHEMANDLIGDRSVALSYCTLCGSGVLYDTGSAQQRRVFATSGLLYRSNKLMFDRETRTLWSNLYGEPVIGRLADRPEDHRLNVLPMTRTSWAQWRDRHPETLVVDLTRELKKEGRKFGFDYRPGKADEARRGVSFPVWKKSDALPPDEEVYVLRLGSHVRAYPVGVLFDRGVIHDRVGDQPVVLVADDESGAVRAYRSNRRLSTVGDLENGELRSADGGVWRLQEDALVNGKGERSDRLAGHMAFWFGWYAFYPQTEVYGLSPIPSPSKR